MKERGIAFQQVRDALANVSMEWADKIDPTVRIQIGEVGDMRIKVVWRPSHNFVITVADFDQ